ncbi:BQ2448_2788 [Microbotryum intermedium]|uniref:BQ2448_2788 protein n=1 Tax=Microbotryum intermedium TaxID=269621 RepID=A0A238FBH5_9BASI|nr:BQ2448_2788 [Microbotryum intermedium]
MLLHLQYMTSNSTQKLAIEGIKASSALKEWGVAEGPDLGDILTKISMLYDYASSAEKAYAEHTGNARLHFKEIRTREEHLTSLKKSKENLGNKIENLDRKVSKMKEENKDLPASIHRLSEMRNEMIGLEHSVLNEESKLGDFKRSIVREAMSLKLGALLEMAEKLVVVAELGKLMIDEIPTERTEPGAPRAHYNSYDRTDELMQQAQRCIQDVVFNPVPLSEDEQYDHNRHRTGEDDYRAAQQQAGGASVDDYRADYGAMADGKQWGTQSDQYGHHEHYTSGSQAPALPEIYSQPLLPPGAGSATYGGNNGREQQHDQQQHAPESSGALAAPFAHYESCNQPSSPYMGSNGSNTPYLDAPTGSNRPSFEHPAAVQDPQARTSYDQESPALIKEREQAEEAARAAQQPNPWRQDSQPNVSSSRETEGQSQGYPNGSDAAAAAPLPAYVQAERPRTPVQDPQEPTYVSPSAIGSNAVKHASPVVAGTSSYIHPDYDRAYVPKAGDGAYHGQPAGAPPLPSNANASGTNAAYFPPVNTAPAPPPIPSTPTSPSLSSANRRPVVIRGESALGSKHGDVFVANRAPIDGGALNAAAPSGPNPSSSGYPAGPGTGGASGYYRSADANSGSGKIPAGAFRRGPSNQYMAGGVVAGGQMLPGPPRANDFGPSTTSASPSPSESMSIRDQYLARDAALLQQQQQQQKQQQVEGFAGVGAGPRFDVTPLNISGRNSMIGSAPSEVGSSIAPPSYHPSSQPQPPQQGSRSGTGFNSSHFVTRLD